jgi:hypothetical protein
MGISITKIDKRRLSMYDFGGKTSGLLDRPDKN